MGKTTDLVAVNELTVVRTRLGNMVTELQKKCEESRSEGSNLTTLSTEDEHWYWNTEHKVTGKEVNKLISEIQKVLSRDAVQRKSLWQSLVDVYKTIGGLDADYLSKIEKSFDQINDNYERIKENTQEICRDQKEIENHRVRIDQLIQGHELALKVLKQFKARIDNLSHLEEMDRLLGKINIEKSFKQIDVNYQKLLNQSKSQSDSLANTKAEIKRYEERARKADETISGHEAALNEIKQFNVRIDKSVGQINENCERIEENVQGTQAEVKQLEERAGKADETISGHEAAMMQLKKRMNQCALGIIVAFILSMAAVAVVIFR